MNNIQFVTAPLLLCATIGFASVASSNETWDQAKTDATEMGHNASKAPGEAWDTAKQAGKDGWDTTKAAGHEISEGAKEFGADVKDGVTGK
jgi:hypothetical protein